MNSKLHPQKILVNGCSHSQAIIPNLSKEDGCKFSWPVLLSEKMNCEVINLATSGKNNYSILEETQRYLLNYSDVDHVIVQLTVNDRINLYQKNASFHFVPGDPTTQFDRLDSEDPGRYPRYYVQTGTPCTLKVEKPEGWREWEIGDLSGVYGRLNTATQLFSLYFYCSQNNIKLTVLNYDIFVLDDEQEDAVFKRIPSEIFVHDKLEIGLYRYLSTLFKVKEGHFVKEAHDFIAEFVMDHIFKNKQLDIDLNSLKTAEMREIIYDYSS